MTKLLPERSCARVETHGKKTFIEGIFLQSGITNENNRLYPKQVLEAAVDSVQEKIKEGSLMGELGHADNMTLNLERVSHVVESLRRKDNNWYGRARVIDAGAGKIAKSIIEAGGKIGISSRGVGSLKQDKNKFIVQDDYKLVTIDLCGDPSGPDCWVEAIQESIQSNRLSINESATALRILQDMGHGLADLQARNGYDFDSRAGNQFVGSDAFPSTKDHELAKLTYLERLERDKALMLQALEDLQQQIQLTANGLSPNEVSSYSQLHGSKDPLKRASLRKAMKEEQHKEKIRNWTVGLLSRVAKKGMGPL
jgi:hypothetical protein